MSEEAAERDHGSPEPLAPRCGPDRDEWEAHKDRIELLYCERQLPLKDVIRIMQKEHGFHGTARMYKVRFKQWGFRKNLKKSETLDVWSQAHAGTAHLPMIRGRHLGPKRLKEQVDRFNQRKTMNTCDGVSPVYIKSPDALHHLDSALHQIWRYTEGHLSSKHWDLTTIFSWNDESLNWGVVLREAAFQLSADGDAPKGFELLDDACDKFRDVARKQQPLLLWNLIVSITEISSAADRRVIASFTNYLVAMCTIELGPSHPLTMLCANLRSMDRLSMRSYVASFLGAQLDLLSKQAQRGDVLAVFMRMITSQWLNDMGLILDFSFARMISDVSTELKASEMVKASNFGLGVAWGALLLTQRLIAAGRLVDANALLACVKRCAEDLGGDPALMSEYTKLKATFQEDSIKLEYDDAHFQGDAGETGIPGRYLPPGSSRPHDLDSNAELRHVLNGLEALKIYRGAWPVR
ncbi:hypothetical protein PFICI_01065 [Pestalotiopsis fici W106-1]|uniref:Clr5 domain-containing protein n=1 Tax=Pestalotiopsis fici (strain W106-1 / CGMCC3.15140) TaxID=1229662 RepID=W3XP14_PESFW|nr:uncharacterized protein PFICI_01065 [Pestalotiopsis fici W106-1]ETS87237.1 hypothetical protein PFICI_01065 [Pestalotiopsis fici W106-1]